MCHDSHLEVIGQLARGRFFLHHVGHNDQLPCQAALIYPTFESEAINKCLRKAGCHGDHQNEQITPSEELPFNLVCPVSTRFRVTSQNPASGSLSSHFSGRLWIPV